MKQFVGLCCDEYARIIFVSSTLGLVLNLMMPSCCPIGYDIQNCVRDQKVYLFGNSGGFNQWMDDLAISMSTYLYLLTNIEQDEYSLDRIY